MAAFIGANNIVSPLGFTTPENFNALLQNYTAVKQTHFPFSKAPFYCAKIEDTILNKAFQTLDTKGVYTHLEKMCLLSINDVVQKSGVDLGDKNNLLVLSTTKGNIDVLEKVYSQMADNRAYLSQFAQMVGSYFKCANKPLIVSNACISGLLAMVIAQRLIDNKNYKNIIVCGADIVSEFTLSGFKSFNALSNELCMPFDKNRTGINLGEVAASVLLSSNEISNIKLVSGSSANDANHISGPSRTGDGLYQAVSNTLKDAGKNNIDFISAHGTATEYNDEMEAIAFNRLQLQHVPLNSLKGYYGHTLGAAGVVESVITIESMKQNKLIQSKGFETVGTTQTLNVIKQSVTANVNLSLKTASGFGGCNAAALFEKV